MPWYTGREKELAHDARIMGGEDLAAKYGVSVSAVQAAKRKLGLTGLIKRGPTPTTGVPDPAPHLRRDGSKGSSELFREASQRLIQLTTKREQMIQDLRDLDAEKNRLIETVKRFLSEMTGDDPE